MTYAPRMLIIFAVVLLAMTGVRADSSLDVRPPSPLVAALAWLPDPLPEPPIGALLFGALGWWLLMRRRPQRRADFND